MGIRRREDSYAGLGLHHGHLILCDLAYQVPFLHYHARNQALMQFTRPKRLCKATLSDYPSLEEIH